VRVLLVSYYFPPAAGGGVQRVLKWAKYLPQSGIEVHVLAPDDPRWLDSGGGLRVTPGTHVHRSRNLSPRSVRPVELMAAARGPVKKAWTRLTLQPRRLLFPDIHRPWAWTAVRAGVAAVREHGIDVVISTSPPETDHLIGQRIARRCGVPWVADYRDSWLDLPHLRLDRTSVRAKHARSVRLATRLMRSAAAAITVSEPLAADLRERHPNVDVHVIPNGVDLADLEGLPEPPPNERFTVTYTGNFFGRQSPASLMDGLRLLVARRPDAAKLMRVLVIGALKPGDDETVRADPALHGVVELAGFRDYEDVLAAQRAADVLYLYVAPGSGSAGVFTGKVFEYVAARRPVLAAVPADNVSAGLLDDAGSTAARVDPNDAEAIANVLDRELTSWLEHGRRHVPVPDAVLARISRQAQTRQLAELLRSVTGITN
jgi:glycosyltransferase involved in cell wall biosynthesis